MRRFRAHGHMMPRHIDNEPSERASPFHSMRIDRPRADGQLVHRELANARLPSWLPPPSSALVRLYLARIASPSGKWKSIDNSVGERVKQGSDHYRWSLVHDVAVYLKVLDGLWVGGATPYQTNCIGNNISLPARAALLRIIQGARCRNANRDLLYGLVAVKTRDR